MNRAWALAAVIIILLLACFLALQVEAHGDADWIRKDPLTKQCCTEKDCKRIPDGDVVRTATGWLILSTGETVLFARAKVSINHHFWVCRTHAGQIRTDGLTDCFFAPPQQSTRLFSAANRRGNVCGNRLVVIKGLLEQYREHPAITAIDATGAIVEYFVSARGTWTMLFTMPGGPTCFGASGEGWGPTPAGETATRAH